MRCILLYFIISIQNVEYSAHHLRKVYECNEMRRSREKYINVVKTYATYTDSI